MSGRLLLRNAAHMSMSAQIGYFFLPRAQRLGSHVRCVNVSAEVQVEGEKEEREREDRKRKETRAERRGREKRERKGGERKREEMEENSRK